MNGHREKPPGRTPLVFVSGWTRIPQAEVVHSPSGIYRRDFTIFTRLAVFAWDFKMLPCGEFPPAVF